MLNARRYLPAIVATSLVSMNASAFDIEAHRGGRALRPENTLQSFANALSIGVDTLELDLGVTKDHFIVVSHERGLNPDLARDPQGNYITAPGPRYKSLTLAEVKQYDVGQIRPGSAYAAKFPDQLAVPGTKIPTLSEVFALVRKSGNKKIKLNIETKIDPDHPEETLSPEAFTDLLLALLKREKFEDRVMVQSFDWRTLQIVHKKVPSIPTVYLTEQDPQGGTVSLDKASKWTAGFDPKNYGGSLPKAIKAAGGNIWSPLYTDVNRANIDEAHQLGLTVVVWTVNDADAMTKLIGMGVDGIISDRPDLLRSTAAANGIAVPAPTPVQP